VYCNNCHEFFCEEHDELAHGGEDQDPRDERERILKDLRTKHIKDNVDDARTNKFGKCPVHPNRLSEYYDKRAKKAFCTKCAIEKTMGRPEDLSKKDEHGNLEIDSSLEPLDEAYRVAKKKATSKDTDLEEMVLTIRSKLDTIKQQIHQLTENADKALAQIKQIAEKAQKDLLDSVAEKTNILKSDRLELARQWKEIDFMKDFLAAQSEGSNALEFLKLNEGHDLLKAQILEQEKALT
jgi:hypothetical protein